MNMPFIPGVGVPVPEESRLSQPMARLPQASTVSRCRGHGTDDRITALSWKRNDRAAPGFPVTVLTLVSPPSVGTLWVTIWGAGEESRSPARSLEGCSCGAYN